MFPLPSRHAIAATFALAALALSGCSSVSSHGSHAAEDSHAAAGPARECGSVRIAVNPWTGAAANAGVIGYLAKERLGCTVSYVPLTEEQNWSAMESGAVDIVPEIWGHEAYAAPYIEVKKTVVDAGATGGDGTLGWFVPPWMAKQYPDITSWQSLNKYAPLFQTPKSAGKGQLLTNDPANVNNDAALISNLGLNYTVVNAASEKDVAQAFRDAERNRTPLLAFFHAPQWVFTELKLARVALPTYDAKKPECAPTLNARCDYPQYGLTKLMSKSFADTESPAALLARDFSWTNKDQNSVAAGIDREGKTPEEAAKAWVEANPEKVDAFLARALA